MCKGRQGARSGLLCARWSTQVVECTSMLANSGTVCFPAHVGAIRMLPPHAQGSGGLLQGGSSRQPPPLPPRLAPAFGEQPSRFYWFIDLSSLMKRLWPLLSTWQACNGAAVTAMCALWARPPCLPTLASERGTLPHNVQMHFQSRSTHPPISGLGILRRERRRRRLESQRPIQSRRTYIMHIHFSSAPPAPVHRS